MKSFGKILAACAVCLLSYLVFAADWVSPVVSSGEVRVGEWNSNFTACKEYAEYHALPLIVFFGETGCEYCRACSANLATDKEFLSWQTQRPVVLCYKHPTGSMTEDDRLADRFTYGLLPGGGYEQGHKPGIVFYQKGLSGDRTLRFTGRDGEMPIGKTGKSLAMQLADSADWYFESSFFPSEGVFKAGNTPAARLEVEYGRETPYVDVPVTRTNSFSVAMSNLVVATFGKSYERAAWAEWNRWDETVYVRIPMPTGLVVDDVVSLKLYSAAHVLLDESAITCVNPPENNPKNPLWIGTKTASELAWGEWTMDYDVARSKVAATEESAFTLVLVGGSTWCPDCVKVDHYLIDTPQFHDWAVSHRIACVAVDVPKMDADEPSLLTYGTCAVSSRYINSTVPRQEAYQSGAGYLSRNMIAPAEAAAIAARNHAFLYNDTRHGGLCRPENVDNNVETQGFKTGIPCLILLRKDGSVAGRIYQFNNTSPAEFEAGNIVRLNELLAQADDPQEEDNDHVSTTAAVLRPGVKVSSSVSPTDARDVWRLEARDGRARVTLLGDGPASNVTLRISQLRDGELVDLDTASGPLENGLSVESAFVGDAVYVTVEAGTSFDPNPKSHLPTDTADLVRAYELSASVTVIPSEVTVRHLFDASVGTAVFEAKAEMSYWIEGLGDLIGTEGLEKVADNVYRSTVSGNVTVPLAEPSDGIRMVVCRTWTGGEVGFVSQTKTVRESEAGVVDIALSRTSGESGFVSANVTLRRDEAAARALADGRIVWQDAVVRWENGVSGTTNVALKVVDDIFYDGDLTLCFDVAILASEIEGVKVREGSGTCSVTILEDDPESPGRLAITTSRPAFATARTIKAEAGTSLRIGVSRIEGATGAVTAYVVMKEGETELSRSAVLTWLDRSRETLQWANLTVPPDASGRRLTVELVATGAAVADADRSRVAVDVLSIDGPAFAEDAVTLSSSCGFSLSRTVAVSRTAGFETVFVKKTSGSLPPGVQFDYADGVFAVSGTPLSSGSFAAAYQVFGQTGSVVVPGSTLRLEFEVSDVLAQIQREMPSLAKARTYRNVPVSDGFHLTGLLTITVPPTGRASARYRTPTCSWAYSADGWAEYEAGVSIGATLDNTRQEGSLALVVRTDGTAEVSFSDPGTGKPVAAVLPEREWGATASAADWQGRYTVQMPQTNVVQATATTPAHATGAAFLTLRMTEAGARSGIMTYAGLLPNGLAVSGSATLVPQRDGRVRLPFLNASKASQTACVLTGAFDIRPKAEEEHVEYRWSVKAAEDAVPYWASADALGGGAEFAVFGGYYDRNEISKCFTNDYGIAGGGFEPFGFLANGDGALEASPRYGAIAAFARVNAFVDENEPYLVGPDNPDDVKLSFNADTGVLSGTLKVPLADGKHVSAKWRGVLLPGWGGCASCEQPGSVAVRPFMSGSCWFTDRSGTRSFRNGCEVLMDRLSAE